MATRGASGRVHGAAWIAQAPGSAPNVKLVGTHRGAYFMTTRPIEAGEELLTLYGEEYDREYPSPFGWMDREAVARFREFW